MIRKSAAGARRQTLGMLSVAAGVSIFSLQDAIVKWMSASFPVHEIVFVRSLVAFPLLLFATVAEARGWPAFRRLGLHFLRGLLMYVAFTACYLAIAHLQIAETVALFFVAPLLVAALSAPVLGERVTPRSWIAIAIGGAGMLVILRPGPKRRTRPFSCLCLRPSPTRSRSSAVGGSARARAAPQWRYRPPLSTFLRVGQWPLHWPAGYRQ